MQCQASKALPINSIVEEEGQKLLYLLHYSLLHDFMKFSSITNESVLSGSSQICYQLNYLNCFQDELEWKQPRSRTNAVEVVVELVL